jgi:hypothetical protein
MTPATLADPLTGEVLCCACRQLWRTEREAWLCNHVSRVPVVPGYPLPRRVPAPVEISPALPAGRWADRPGSLLVRGSVLVLVVYVVAVVGAVAGWWT